MIPESVNARALYIEGNRQMAESDAPGAEACFREAVRISPDFAEGYANLGFLLHKRGVSVEAEACYRRSISLNAGYSETHLNLGSLLAKQKRYVEAEAAYRLAISLSPRSPVGWSNLGALYACMKREDEAEQCYHTAINLDKGDSTARFNLSYVLLRQGRFEEGWRCFESRNWHTVLTAHLACPPWQGEALCGNALPIGGEAGHGDIIQVCRYASVLKAQGAAHITMICPPALKTLFASLDGVDTVIALNEQISQPTWDFWIAPLSIPYHCKTRIHSIPAAIPYLRPLPERIAKWAPMLPAEGIRVGLVWRGSPQQDNDADRSVPGLDLLIPLAAIANVHLISLQKGAGETEAEQPPPGLPLIHLGSKIEDFADTAAIVASLDLVICVDTAIAHLAGALGKLCWVLLPYYMTDWRWLTERTDSPWYPVTMRLFRQPGRGDWKTVIAEVGTALEQFAQERRADSRPLREC